ncbi:MAG: polysaccharide deacetylase family protein [Clostridium sp.]|jgi:peptidoglycan/xylan/chitin deacetylase (PgdA/CDA1 family)|nr:polysaccharide deacetylase family protein [Clostridium sp.]
MEKKIIALTFDDGPVADTTPKLLDLLTKYNVKASFFVVGDQLKEPNVRYVYQEHELGHEIENHSRSHLDMKDMNEEEIRDQIDSTSDKIEEITGRRPKFFRPPYILLSDLMYEKIDLTFICGYAPGDYIPDITVQALTDGMLSNAKDGLIVLIHDFPGNVKMLESLETVIPKLLDEGYEFVTVEELFTKKGVVPQKGVMYSEV